MSNGNPNPNYRPRSLFGPMVLVGIGVLFLLRNMGFIPHLGWWFSRYWPVLLILWGASKLIEQIWARQKGYPAPGIGAGSVFLLILLIMIGMGASAARNVNWAELDGDVNFNDDDFFSWFGNRYEFTNSFAQTIEPGKPIKILVSRGDLNVTPSSDDQTHVIVHKSLFGDSESEAKSRNDATNPKFEQRGDSWLLDLTGDKFNHGRFNLDVQVPKNFPISLFTGRGDIQVSDRGGKVDLESGRGSVSASNITGNATLKVRRGNVTVKNVNGDVALSGSVLRTDISDVTGLVALNGSYWNTTELARIGKQVSFKSDRTDMQFSKLAGDLNMESGSLHASSLTGPFRLRTSSKNVELENLDGDVQIEDRNAPVELHLKAPLGKVEIENQRGQIIVDVPADSGFQVDAESNYGNIQSDFDLNITSDQHNRDVIARGTVGKGGPQIHLHTDRGTIHIRKD
ncbi:MAG TPA: DUF4097 family beta strand repeat-containing protein [Candidatus Angelobacter sp.]|nr:DUF4097 family beta strand repeat-containing protein [Candidatus Angelobacter sp.]